MPGGIAFPVTPVTAPVGSVAAWLKSYANTPALPSGWVECNGQTLNDPQSVYHNQSIPNLNGENRFLRGNASSGGAGGAATVTLTLDQMPSHAHGINVVGVIGSDMVTGGEEGAATGVSTESTGGDQAHENLPPYYNVVWIMRVK